MVCADRPKHLNRKRPWSHSRGKEQSLCQFHFPSLFMFYQQIGIQSTSACSIVDNIDGSRKFIQRGKVSTCRTGSWLHSHGGQYGDLPYSPLL